MTDPATAPAVGAPTPTGHASIDAALAALADLDRVDLAGHHPRLAEAHEELHCALDEATHPGE